MAQMSGGKSKPLEMTASKASGTGALRSRWRSGVEQESAK